MSVPADPVRVTVRCFAAVREALGHDQLVEALPAGATVALLRQRLAVRAPALDRLPLAVAVNRAYATFATELRDGDEVAFIPPISGGDEPPFRFTLHGEALDARALELECRTDRDGAVVTFAGVTRDHNDGAAVVSLSYEAYAEMAATAMAAIFADAQRQFAITRARVAHRLGTVPVGEASVVVVVSAAHRGPAFDACRYLMDRLKHEVPIWKREQLREGGGSRWVGELPRPNDDRA
jgi:molybdopterin synthase catalytic subunit